MASDTLTENASDFALTHGTHVLVCDGARALILRNQGTPGAPDLVTVETADHVSPKTSELGTDAPGRSFASVGTNRSSMEQTDWHTREEQHFLDGVAGRLEKLRQAGEVKALVVAAPPAALGRLRQSLSPQLRALVRAEVEKDYVHEPVPQIARHLRVVLQSQGK
jgi:protein required for attachment to host cells